MLPPFKLPPPPPLGRDFNILWGAESVSVVGSALTVFALPLLAAETLHATAQQMGWLAAAGWLPFLLIGLFVGAWVDRRAKRPILIWCNALRALLLMSVPAVGLLGWLTLPFLLVISLLHGFISVFFYVAYPSYVPALVAKPELGRANSRMVLSESVADVSGPGLAGLLVQQIGTPFVIGLDAISFAISALVLTRIHTVETVVHARDQAATMWHGFTDGLKFLFAHPTLRLFLLLGALSNLAGGMTNAVNVLFGTRELGLSPAALGLAFAGLGPGAILGSLLAMRISTRLGVSRAILSGVICFALANLVPGLLHGAGADTVALWFGAYAVMGLGSTIWNINVISFRQRVAPPELLGRANAGMRTIVMGMLPIGAVIGGAVGDALGTRTTVLLAAGLGFVILALAVGLGLGRGAPRAEASHAAGQVT